MKKFLALIFCLCFMFSSICLAESKDNRDVKSQKIANARFPNIFRPIKDLFKKILRIKSNVIYCPPPSSVENLILSQYEIIIGKTTEIQIEVVAFDIENDVLTYDYKVSGGKIVGEGAKVTWDLSGIKPGSYTITVAVDDGCGFCGKTQTKTIIVKECPDCK